MTEFRGIKIKDAPLSAAEETFAVHLRAHGFPPPVREYLFMAPHRRWRFDFAWPEQRVAVEIEGVLYGGHGRHQRGAGYASDCEKYNTAALLGWQVLRFTQAMVKNGNAIEYAALALGVVETCQVGLRSPTAIAVVDWED